MLTLLLILAASGCWVEDGNVIVMQELPSTAACQKMVEILRNLDIEEPSYTCMAADMDKDGYIGGKDYTACNTLEGKEAKACSALVAIYYGDSC